MCSDLSALPGIKTRHLHKVKRCEKLCTLCLGVAISSLLSDLETSESLAMGHVEND